MNSLYSDASSKQQATAILLTVSTCHINTHSLLLLSVTNFCYVSPFLQVLEPVRDSAAGAECRHEHHHVHNDPPVRNGAAQQRHHADARTRVLR